MDNFEFDEENLDFENTFFAPIELLSTPDTEDSIEIKQELCDEHVETSDDQMFPPFHQCTNNSSSKNNSNNNNNMNHSSNSINTNNIVELPLTKNVPLIPMQDQIDYPLKLSIFHKPRGSKGIFCEVEKGTKIRVSKSAGKKLRLLCLVNFEYDKNTPQLQLLEGTDGSETLILSHAKVDIDSIKMLDRNIEIEVKLFEPAKRLVFSLEIRSKNGEYYRAQTVEFATHNSGGREVNNNNNNSLNSSSPSVINITSSSPTKDTKEPVTQQPKKRKMSINNEDSLEMEENVIHSNPKLVQSKVNSNSNSASISSSSASHRFSHLLPELSQIPPNQQIPIQYPNQLPPFNQTNFANSFQTRPSSCSNNPEQNQVPPDNFPSDPNNPPLTFIPGSLEVDGIVKARGFLQFSDLRLKTNISDIVDALEIVTNLQGKTYEWKQDETDDVNSVGGRRVVGLIAQEVQRVLPEVVQEDPQTGLLSVSYAEILPVLIEAFKEFIGYYEVDKEDMRSELAKLKSQLDSFSEELKQSKKKNTNPDLKKMVQRLTLSSRNLFHTPPPGPSRCDNYAPLETFRESSHLEKQNKSLTNFLISTLQVLIFFLFIGSLATMIVGLIMIVSSWVNLANLANNAFEIFLVAIGLLGMCSAIGCFCCLLVRNRNFGSNRI